MSSIQLLEHKLISYPILRFWEDLCRDSIEFILSQH